MPLFSVDKTFKARKNVAPGSRRFELHKLAKATLGSGVDLHEVVKLPLKQLLEDWLAVNIVDFYNLLCMLYGSVSEFCTDQSCPSMNAGPKYEYKWKDENSKKVMDVTAPQYVDKCLNWIATLIDDPSVFPPNITDPFPKNFKDVAKQIFKRMFRIYAHVYYHHFHKIVQLQEEAHLNTNFKHFYYFISEFQLVDAEEQAPLKDLIQRLISK